MPGLATKAQVGQSLFVYNDDGAFIHAPVGAYLWCGQVLSVEHDDADPKKCRYRIWGPGGEESNVVTGACLEIRSRPGVSKLGPVAPVNPLDEALTLARLREGLDGAALRLSADGDVAGPVATAALTAVRSLIAYWEREAAAGQLTVYHVMRHYITPS
jgi:hypothetical protein